MRISLLVFSRCLGFHHLVQLFFVNNAWSPIPILRLLGKWPWQMACQSSSTSGGAHLLFPTSVVLMKVRNTPSSCARSVKSPAPSRTTASGKSVENFGFTTFLDSMFFSKSPALTSSWLSTVMKLLSPSSFFEPTSFWQALNHHLDWAVTIFPLVCRKLDRIDQVHFCISAVRAVLLDQDSVRGLPNVLAGASRTPLIALLLPVSRRDPPNGVFKQEIGGN